MNPQEAWNIAYNQLEIQLDRASFETWLRNSSFLGFADGVFTIGVNSSIARDMLQGRYYRDIRRAVQDAIGERAELSFVLHKAVAATVEQDELPLFQMLQTQPAPEAELLPLYQQVAKTSRPELPDSQLTPRFTFPRFVANKANRLTLEAALAVSEHPGSHYNPLMIHGGVGLGKTHLMQAIGHVCQLRGLKVLYTSSEMFTNDLVNAIRQRTTAMFRETYRSVDVLLVDDVQFWAGKESSQEEFFHTFNALHRFNKQIVMASDRPPAELVTLEDRLRSRFMGGLVMDLQPPEYETRLAILQMWAQERSVTLTNATAQHIADRAQTNIRELEGLFNQMVATAQLSRQVLTPDMADGVIEQFRRPRHHQLSIDRVLEITANYHRVSVQDLISPRRSARLTQARQIAMYLARELTFASLPQIGNAFGGRTHSTVLHACNKVAGDLAWDDILRRSISEIEAVIRSE